MKLKVRIIFFWQYYITLYVYISTVCCFLLASDRAFGPGSGDA